MAYNYGYLYPFEVHIVNLRKQKEGVPAGEWVKLPATHEEMLKVMERIGIGTKDRFGKLYDTWCIKECNCYVEGFIPEPKGYHDLNELNYLAYKLDDLSDAEYECFEAVISIYDEYTSRTRDLINLTDNLNKYELYTGVEDFEDLARYYVDELKVIQLPEHFRKNMNYEEVGQAIVLVEKGKFSRWGYVKEKDEWFREYYDGNLRSIPTKYCMCL